jgi:hypothetical protein
MGLQVTIQIMYKKYSTVFCGCSYVRGHGLSLLDKDPSLWVNVLYQLIPQLRLTNLINQGVSGSTNEQIFMSALSVMTEIKECRYMFVSWTSLKRIHLNPSVELYDTSLYLENSKIIDVKINPNITIPGSYVENIRDRFFNLNHIHYDILTVLKYTKILSDFAKKFNIQIFFINSLLPVDQHYFVQVLSNSRVPSDTTPYTQKILNLVSRSDLEYFKIYDLLHESYKNTQALDSAWLNLDIGYRMHFYLDQANDQLHPGPKSNLAFAHFIKEKLEPNLEI